MILFDNKNFDNSISSTYQQNDNIWKLKDNVSIGYRGILVVTTLTAFIKNFVLLLLQP